MRNLSRPDAEIMNIYESHCSMSPSQSLAISSLCFQSQDLKSVHFFLGSSSCVQRGRGVEDEINVPIALSAEGREITFTTIIIYITL